MLPWNPIGVRIAEPHASPARSLLAAVTMAAVAAAPLATLGTAARADTSGFYGTAFEKTPNARELTALGRALFFEPGLSASRRQSCASCHDPAHAFGPAGDAAVERGGPGLATPGVRAVPSLRYLQSVPPFTEHMMETDGNDSEDQGPAGGHTWDGRVSSKHDQARIPLLSPFEMANASEDAVVARVAASREGGDFRAAFGPHLFDDRAKAFRAIVLALEVFQQSPEDFYPYSSKYDAVLRRRATLTDAEARGLALFDDRAKGNCASCHPSRIKEGGFPAFTDFGYVALGVPRNAAIPANARRDYRDLGLCGPYRVDLASRTEYCGLFRAPTLRNVALRRNFFHNGSVHSLDAAVRFYVERDLRPARWYPSRDGRVVRDDDLPHRYAANLEHGRPFEPLPGGRPALDDREIADIVAFLRTLTDGYEAGPASSASR